MSDDRKDNRRDPEQPPGFAEWPVRKNEEVGSDDPRPVRPPKEDDDNGRGKR